MRNHVNTSKRCGRKNPGATVVVTGSYAETLEKMEGVDYVIAKTEEARRDTCGSTKRSQNE